MTDEPCAHGCQCDFCREDEPVIVSTQEELEAVFRGLKPPEDEPDGTMVSWMEYARVPLKFAPEEISVNASGSMELAAKMSSEEISVLNRLLDGSPRPLPQLDLLKMTVADQEWHWRHESSEMSGAVLARYYSMTHAHCTQCSCGFCKTWGPPGTMHKPDCECMECDYRVKGLAKMRDDVRAEAQEAGETSEQPLAVCWASAKGSPLWSDPQPPVAAGTDPIKAMDASAARKAATVLETDDGEESLRRIITETMKRAGRNRAVPYTASGSSAPAARNAMMNQKHPSGVQMLIDDVIAVTRERDAAIAEMGRLEKERDEALAICKLRAEFWTEECNKWANRRDTFEAEQASLRLQIVDLRRERDVASLALAAMKRSYRELEARVAGTVPPPVPDIPLRALGSTHAATGLKMGERR